MSRLQLTLYFTNYLNGLISFTETKEFIEITNNGGSHNHQQSQKLIAEIKRVNKFLKSI